MQQMCTKPTQKKTYKFSEVFHRILADFGARKIWHVVFWPFLAQKRPKISGKVIFFSTYMKEFSTKVPFGASNFNTFSAF